VFLDGKELAFKYFELLRDGIAFHCESANIFRGTATRRSKIENFVIF
jgi:hypothetical protein